MNILAIGNSFSADATRYLYDIARADGYDLTVVNLYIGGCPFSKHYRNMLAENNAYEIQFNGVMTGFGVSIKEALLSRDWDYVTFQQVSHQSVDYETYQPYLNELSAYVKKYAPKAKQVIHQTWAYEQDSNRLCVELGYKDQKDMYNDIKSAYDKAAQAIDAEFIIPSGTLFQKLVAEDIKVHRDTFHASLGLGRYALGLLWYAMFTGNDAADNSFRDFDEEVSEELVALAKKCVKETISK